MMGAVPPCSSSESLAPGQRHVRHEHLQEYGQQGGGLFLYDLDLVEEQKAPPIQQQEEVESTVEEEEGIVEEAEGIVDIVEGVVGQAVEQAEKPAWLVQPGWAVRSSELVRSLEPVQPWKPV